MALANVNNQKRQVLSGLFADRPTATIFYGDVYYATDNGLWYIYTPSGWVVESLPTIGSLTALLAQNQTAKLASHSFVFDADDLVKTTVIAYNGLVKHLHLVVPNFTNVVMVTVILVDASGRIVWTSAAKAKNASYNLELDTAAQWADQLVDSTLIWTVTISGVAGGAGGTVVLVPRYYGV